MTAVWISILLTAGAMAIVLMSWRHCVDMAELGTVSQQWLAEHRANDWQYSGR